MRSLIDSFAQWVHENYWLSVFVMVLLFVMIVILITLAVSGSKVSIKRLLISTLLAAGLAAIIGSFFAAKNTIPGSRSHTEVGFAV